MDPRANLEEQLKLARRLQRALDVDANDFSELKGVDQILADAERLADLVLVLDEWIKKGGFSPYTIQ
jgi:hypothetical protein